MGKIQRRRKTVTLYQGNFEQELVELATAALQAEEEERTQGPARTGQKSEAMDLARQHDELKAKAEADAAIVPVWAISRLEYPELADRHEPRDDNPEDKRRGLNMKTFPEALLKVSLVDPETPVAGDDPGAVVTEKLRLGEAILNELDLSQVHYLKLETAAWNVNLGDDSLPKYSLVSVIQAERESESRPRSEQESAREDSTGTSPPKRTGT